MSSLNTFYRSVIKSLMGRYLVYIANIVSMMIMARLFSPQLYGVLASLTVFLTFFQLMTEAGLGPAIINIKKLDSNDKNGLFGLTVIIGLISGVFFLLLGDFFVGFYENKEITEIVPYISISIFLYAVSTIPTAFLLRQQSYKYIAYAGLSSEFISTASSILLLQVISPLHALAAKSAISALVSFIVIYKLSSRTEFGAPKLGSRFSAIKPLLSFSLYQFGFNFINYFSRNLDKILIGKYIGVSELGVYDKSYQLMRYPLMLLTFAMTPAIQPALREHVHDVTKIEAIHREFTFKLSILGGFAGLAMFFMSDLIVSVLLGSQWMSVAPIIKILAITVPVQVVLSTSGSFFQAMGRVDLLFLSGSLSAIIMVTGIIFGVLSHNLQTLSWYLVIAFHLNFIQAYYIMYTKIYKVNVLLFFRRMVVFFVAVIIMVLWALL